MNGPRVVLASTSRYRAQLLRRLLPCFESCAPGTEETPGAGEKPADMALRLATAKARAVAGHWPDALIIGSDQVAARDGTLLGKPGDRDTARRQLKASSARTVSFHTAVCLLDTRKDPAGAYTALDITRVHFRALGTDEVERYLDREEPLDCAGSFKCEALGISLFERIECTDPTALVGLPLMALSRLLRDCGVPVP